MSADTHPPRVLATGSLDVDNFGDLLFLLVTEKYLSPAQILASGPFGWDMKALLEREVYASHPLLQAQEFDIIWHVGGELGPATFHDAFKISAPQHVHRKYEDTAPEFRNDFLRRYAGDVPPTAHPYLPDLTSYPLNESTVSVFNSVGVSRILDNNDPFSLRPLITSLLGGATFVSVRDKESSELLTDLQINHRLSPDAVHAISHIWPRDEDPDADLLILQINTRVLSKLGHENMAAAIAQNPSLRRFKIRLLVAGTWRGGDSIEDAEKFIELIKRADPRANVGLLEARRPMDLVDHIRRARIVIGTSLHLRIVACAYNVCRITLPALLPKSKNYAGFWDPEMPYNVPLTELDDAIYHALSCASNARLAEHSANLSRLAHANLQNLVSETTNVVKTQTSKQKERRSAFRHDYKISR